MPGNLVARAIALSVTVCALLVMDEAVMGSQSTPVQVSFPRGMTASGTTVAPGPSADTKYVIIEMLKLHNRSHAEPLNVDYKDFKLQSLRGDYFYVDRKKTESLHFSLSETMLRPGQGTAGSLAFLVPASLTKASLVYHVNQFDANYS